MARRKLNEQGEIRFFEWMEDRIKDEGTGAAFCQKTGLPESSLSALRRGSKAPTVRMAEKLAAAYGLTISDVVGYGGVAEDDYKPRGDRTGKRKKKEPEEPQVRNPMPKISSEILEWAKILREQIMTVDQDIINLENEVRQLKIKKGHYEEILRVFNDWRGIGNAD